MRARARKSSIITQRPIGMGARRRNKLQAAVREGEKSGRAAPDLHIIGGINQPGEFKRCRARLKRFESSYNKRSPGCTTCAAEIDFFLVYSNARAAASQIEKYNVSCTLARETCVCQREGPPIYKIHSSPRARLKREPSGAETHSRDKNAPRVSIGKVSQWRARRENALEAGLCQFWDAAGINCTDQRRSRNENVPRVS